MSKSVKGLAVPPSFNINQYLSVFMLSSVSKMSSDMTLVSFSTINETLDCYISDQDNDNDDQNAIQKDFFENVYSDSLLNGCMIAVYLFGFIGCAGLILVLWFERSGLAGPYRTLVNQLASQNIVQVS